MIRSIRHLRADKAGLAGLEFAMIAPFFACCVLGVFEVTQAYRAQIRVDSATDMIAKIVSNQGTVTKAQMNDYCYGVKWSLAPFVPQPFIVSIASVTNKTGSPQVDWEYDAACGTSGAKLGAQAVSLATATPNKVPAIGNSVIVVSGSYAYNSALTHFVPSLLTLGFIAQPIPIVSGSTVACTDCSS